MLATVSLGPATCHLLGADGGLFTESPASLGHHVPSKQRELIVMILSS